MPELTYCRQTRRWRFVRFSILSATLICCAPTFAQWSGNSSVNTAVCTATLNQTEVRTCSDGANGVIVVWTDRRAGLSNADIYAQRIDSNGVALWTPTNGVVVCTETGDQTVPMIATDGANGAVITWRDMRSGNADVYAQRIDSLGTRAWASAGVAVSATTGNQNAPVIASDGASGALIAWMDSRSGSNDIYANRVSALGSPMWTANGDEVCTATNGQVTPSILGLGGAECIISWSDARGGAGGDIYSQRLNAAGASQWALGGVAVSEAVGTQISPQIISDGAGGAIVAWEDQRIGVTDIYARRIDSSGAPLWTADGVGICTNSSLQAFPSIVPDGSGGAVIAWHDERAGASDYDIYAHRIDGAGNLLWASDGEPVAVVTGFQTMPSLVADGTGNFVTIWSDTRSGTNADIYAQRLNLSGSPLWTANGVVVSSATGNQSEARGFALPLGATGAVWIDDRNGAANLDLYMDRVDAAGFVPVTVSKFLAD